MSRLGGESMGYGSVANNSRLIWNSDIETVSCLTDPRCVAAEHYTPPVDSEDLSIGVPPEERGVIPIWALNVVDYVSSKLSRGLTDAGSS